MRLEKVRVTVDLEECYSRIYECQTKTHAKHHPQSSPHLSSSNFQPNHIWELTRSSKDLVDRDVGGQIK